MYRFNLNISYDSGKLNVQLSCAHLSCAFFLKIYDSALVVHLSCAIFTLSVYDNKSKRKNEQN